MIVGCLVNFHEIHIWRFIIGKFLLWWSTRANFSFFCEILGISSVKTDKTIHYNYHEVGDCKGGCRVFDLVNREIKLKLMILHVF